MYVHFFSKHCKIVGTKTALYNIEKVQSKENEIKALKCFLLLQQQF